MTQPSRFLIIQLRKIGDVLISTTLCETLKRNYPNAQVDYAVYPYAAAVAKNNPFIDNLIVVPNGIRNNALLKILKNIIFMRKQHYHYVVEVLNTPKSIWLAKFSGAKTIIGSKTNKRRTRKYDIQVTYDDDFLADDPVCDSVKNRLCLLEPINKKLSFHTQYKFFLTAQEITQARNTMHRQGIDFNAPIFFFSAGNRNRQKKQWSEDNLVTVINECIVNYHAQVILYPGPKQIRQSLRMRNKTIKPEKIFVFTNTEFREMAAIIKLSDLFVGNDGSPSHIAIAVSTPSVTIFSPAIWHHDWHPRNHARHICINIQDILAIDNNEYEKLLIGQRPTATKKLCQLISPEYVKQAIAKLTQSTFAHNKRRI